uniref:LIM/homeobox protein Awh n=1 Tax=Haemonchus contortus TaxID=6289 RepID=A0A7I4XWU0_HAECO
MEVHQRCFVEATTFATDFPATETDLTVMRSDCVVALPEMLVPRSDFVASTAGVRQPGPSQECAGQIGNNGNFAYAVPHKFGVVVCSGCDRAILERTLLNVNGRSWHEDCLRCALCRSSLLSHHKCYYRNGSTLCKSCYGRQFGTKCASCCRLIHTTDWVRRARSLVFHLACFACAQCKRQLSTGEEFALQDNRLLCKQHFVELVDGDPGTGQQKQKIKRVRTTFAEEQLSVLQAHFQVDSNPDGADLERIASMTGLSKRVTQVWFQNSRARQKKFQSNRKACEATLENIHSMNGPVSPSQKSEASSDGIFPSSVLTSAEEAIGDSTAMGPLQRYE